MSFILDALKKSDKKRQQTSSPRLDTVHVPPVAKKKPAGWRYLLIAVLLLNIGLLSWFFVSGRQAPVSADPPAQQPETLVAAPPVAAPPQPSQQPAPQVKPQPRTAPAVPIESPEKALYAISELPVAVQRRIPALHMSLHAYNKANPSAGMVRVNEQILRQGSRLDDKYLLEEISVDGAIFRFEGYRFLLPRN